MWLPWIPHWIIPTGFLIPIAYFPPIGVSPLLIPPIGLFPISIVSSLNLYYLSFKEWRLKGRSRSTKRRGASITLSLGT